MALTLGRVDPLEIWFGEVRTDAIDITDEDGADLSTLTGTYTVYDADGAVIINAEALTMSGTTTRNASHSISAGVGGDLTQEGRYRVAFEVTDGTDEWIFLGFIVVKDPTA